MRQEADDRKYKGVANSEEHRAGAVCADESLLHRTPVRAGRRGTSPASNAGRSAVRSSLAGDVDPDGLVLGRSRLFSSRTRRSSS
jgi:hypothetical protein